MMGLDVPHELLHREQRTANERLRQEQDRAFEEAQRQDRERLLQRRRQVPGTPLQPRGGGMDGSHRGRRGRVEYLHPPDSALITAHLLACLCCGVMACVWGGSFGVSAFVRFRSFE